MNELYYLQFLSANLGFIVAAPLFSSPLMLLDTVIMPRSWLLVRSWSYLLGSLSLSLAILSMLRAELYPLQYAAGTIGVCVFTVAPYGDVTGEISKLYAVRATIACYWHQSLITFSQCYRMVVSALFMLLSVPLAFPPLLWIGVIGVQGSYYARFVNHRWVRVCLCFCLSASLTPTETTRLVKRYWRVPSLARVPALCCLL